MAAAAKLRARAAAFAIAAFTIAAVTVVADMLRPSPADRKMLPAPTLVPIRPVAARKEDALACILMQPVQQEPSRPRSRRLEAAPPALPLRDKIIVEINSDGYVELSRRARASSCWRRRVAAGQMRPIGCAGRNARGGRTPHGPVGNSCADESCRAIALLFLRKWRRDGRGRWRLRPDDNSPPRPSLCPLARV
jgi:hypothetical protein